MANKLEGDKEEDVSSLTLTCTGGSQSGCFEALTINFLEKTTSAILSKKSARKSQKKRAQHEIQTVVRKFSRRKFGLSQVRHCLTAESAAADVFLCVFMIDSTNFMWNSLNLYSVMRF